MGILAEEAAPFSLGSTFKAKDLLLWEQILSINCRPISKCCLQEFMQVNITLFSDKKQLAFIRAGTFFRIIILIFGFPEFI